MMSTRRKSLKKLAIYLLNVPFECVERFQQYNSIQINEFIEKNPDAVEADPIVIEVYEKKIKRWTEFKTQ